jgi:hypothetical protein
MRAADTATFAFIDFTVSYTSWTKLVIAEVPPEYLYAVPG